MRAAQHRTDRVLSALEAIHTLRTSSVLPEETVRELDQLRSVRNAVVHGSKSPADAELRELVYSAGRIREMIERSERRR